MCAPCARTPRCSTVRRLPRPGRCCRTPPRAPAGVSASLGARAAVWRSEALWSAGLGGWDDGHCCEYVDVPASGSGSGPAMAPVTSCDVCTSTVAHSRVSGVVTTTLTGSQPVDRPSSASTWLSEANPAVKSARVVARCSFAGIPRFSIPQIDHAK